VAGPPPRFRLHFTPTGSSWINQVERWLGYPTSQMIRRGVHKSVQGLEADIRAWIDNWNQDPRPFAWTKTAEEIIDSLGTLVRSKVGCYAFTTERPTPVLRTGSTLEL